MKVFYTIEMYENFKIFPQRKYFDVSLDFKKFPSFRKVCIRKVQIQLWLNNEIFLPSKQFCKQFSNKMKFWYLRRNHQYLRRGCSGARKSQISSKILSHCCDRLWSQYRTTTVTWELFFYLSYNKNNIR